MVSPETFLSRHDIEVLIAQGQTIVIYEGYALRLDRWLEKHPGGKLPIFHMVGRDATDEINVYHFAKTIKIMKAYRIGQVSQPWVNFIPPIQGGVFQQDSDSTDPGSASDSGPQSSWSRAASSSASSVSDESTIGSRLELPRGDAAPIASKRGQMQSESCTRRITMRERIDQRQTKQTQFGNAKLSDMKITRQQYATVLDQKEILDDTRNYPSLDSETQIAISREYKALHARIQAEGFYECRYSEYGKEAIRWSVLFFAFCFLLKAEWYLTSAIFLGMFWQQIMFTAHDAGHRGITGNFVTDTLIGAFVADFCCGLSIGWWKSSHNVHHLVTNMPEHDPDIQNVPLFATSPKFFKSIRSTFYNFTFVWDRAADFLVPYQKYTYYPIMCIARFNLYLLSWLHLLSARSTALGSAWWTRHVELVMMTGYWYIFGYHLLLKTLPDWPTRVAFVLISHTITLLLHVQITLSHWGTSTSDLGPTESFPQRQLRTSMDVDCPAWLDFLHGGLQFQAIHHLFPRVPRHNLRRLQVLVREFCKDVGIEYQCYGFVEGNKIVLSRLEEVSKMVDTLVQCQAHMIETGESGLH